MELCERRCGYLLMRDWRCADSQEVFLTAFTDLLNLLCNSRTVVFHKWIGTDSLPLPLFSSTSLHASFFPLSAPSLWLLSNFFLTAQLAQPIFLFSYPSLQLFVPSTQCLPSLSSPSSCHLLFSCLASLSPTPPPFFTSPPELTFWFYVKEHLNRHELQRFYSLRQISSELGRGRAWLRCALNEHSLERYLHTLLADRPRLGLVLFFFLYDTQESIHLYS